MIDNSELDDCANVIQAGGFELEDFEFLPKENTPDDMGVQPITGTVTIKRISNGIQQTYKAGHRSSWPTEFAVALNNGVFGSAI